VTASSPSDLDFVASHRKIWDSKPCLRLAYGRYHELLLRACPPEARVLELGCGLGALGARAASEGRVHWIASDIIAAPGAQLLCDGTSLPFAPGSLDRVVFVDVLHHLARPLVFFAEAARVLRPGGKIICVEPWVTPLSYPIYRFLHQEGCDLSRSLEAPFAPAAEGKAAYQGDNGIPSLLCRKFPPERWARLGLGSPVTKPFNDFAYLTTRGLRSGRDAPAPLFRLTRAVMDGFLGPLAPVLALRAYLQWEKPGSGRAADSD
jgi:SAM-dependent methyltransferase